MLQILEHILEKLNTMHSRAWLASSLYLHNLHTLQMFYKLTKKILRNISNTNVCAGVNAGVKLKNISKTNVFARVPSKTLVLPMVCARAKAKAKQKK